MLLARRPHRFPLRNLRDGDIHDYRYARIEVTISCAIIRYDPSPTITQTSPFDSDADFYTSTRWIDYHREMRW